jgi:hypothetical protein
MRDDEVGGPTQREEEMTAHGHCDDCPVVLLNLTSQFELAPTAHASASEAAIRRHTSAGTGQHRVELATAVFAANAPANSSFEFRRGSRICWRSREDPLAPRESLIECRV